MELHSIVMLPEEYSVEVVLEAIDAMAPTLPKTRPKVILFDIGGVCVSTLISNL